VTKRRLEGSERDAERQQQYYYHGDHLGSAQIVTDYTGRVYEHIEYTPYGELWIERTTNANNKTPYRFTGKEFDEETGLYYYGARYLDPRTSRWISTDPAMGEYIPGAPVNDEARKRNGNLPGMGGVFNYVNLHTYHYAGNNPVKYVDPDGEEGEFGIYGSRGFFDLGSFVGDPFCRLLDLFHKADSGDQAAKAYLGMVWHQAGRKILEQTSDHSSKATLVFLAVGAPEAAAVSSAVGSIADGLLMLDDILSENYEDAFARGAILVTGVVFDKVAGKALRSITDKAIGITVGKTGRFYEIGRRGAIETKDALRRLITADIAEGVFGQLSVEMAGQLLENSLKAFDELIK
jgi:RHS repeat-associated protein